MSIPLTDSPNGTRAVRSARPDGPQPPIAPPPKLRRRPMLVAAGVVLVALGGLAAFWLTTNVGHTHPVLAMRQTVDRGQTITAADLTTVDISTDSRLRTVPADQMNSVVGKRAVNDLAAGGLVTPESLTTTTLPSAGQSIVGIALNSGQMPALTLRSGASVSIVPTPRAQDTPPTTAPTSIPATVIDTRAGGSNQTVVDVSVPTSAAPLVAAAAATGRVTIILNAAR